MDHHAVNSRFFLRLATGVLLLVIGWQLGAMRERGAHTVFIDSAPQQISPGESASGVTVQDPRRSVDISLLWEVWEKLNDFYIEPDQLQVTPLVYGAAEGLTRAVGDPYTMFMTPKENEEFRDELAGNLEGIGAELVMRDGMIIVVSPLKGSPAEQAGLMPKDVILEVDGQPTDGWSLAQAVSHIRGPKGTSVRIRIGRSTTDSEQDAAISPVEFTITREEIHVPSVESHLIVHKRKTIGYVALNQFGENSIEELKRELRDFKDIPVFGIILDLRNNGGGYLEGAIELAEIFLQNGEVVKVERRHGETDTKTVNGKALLPDTPLVILQNEATASASEIVAGALQDHGRATIVGKKSFGKGTVQEVIGLEGGASLRVTVARWLTPNGKNLGKEGVHPDIEVEPKRPGETPPPVGVPWSWQNDPQVAAGVNALLEGIVEK